MTGRDALDLEPSLRDELGKFLSFENCQIFFPESESQTPYAYDRDGGKLIIALDFVADGRPALLISGVREEEVERLSAILPRLANLCFEKICLQKAASIDALTGLHSENGLFEFFQDRVEKARNAFADPAQTIRRGGGVRAGMIVIDWPSARQIAEEFDYDFKNRAFRGMAKALRRVLPSNAKAAALGKNEGLHEFGVVFPTAGRGKCHILARNLLNALESLLFHDKLTRLDYRPRLVAGHAVYPQDMTGDELALPIEEQITRLRDRARFASRIAISAPSRVAGFAKILQRGGRIVETLADGKLKVNLGRSAGAREGMRFEIRQGRDNLRGGELSLLSVGIKNSVAELISLENPADPPMPGDKLIYIDPRAISLVNLESDAREKAKILGRGEFLALYEEARRDCGKFAFAAVRKIGSADGNTVDIAAIVEEFLERSALNDDDAAPDFIGRSGNNSLVFFHKNSEAARVKEFYENMAAFATEKGATIACGIFGWPFLNFAANESEARAFQSLEYGELSPAPHIGVFDSVALTLGADRKFSRGDVYGAIEDYKLALLASPANAIAKNSLGVCLAGLGKYEDAKVLCLEALARTEDIHLKSQINYNLGTIFDRLQDQKSARKYYRQCLIHDPAHVYAGVRLGKMYETRGRSRVARKLYENSIKYAADNNELKNLAERYLASLNLSSRGIKEGRDRLYNNISRDPEDAASMAMLAASYLAENDNLALAELFARKSANLSGAREAWSLLADALEARDQPIEAEKARARARKASNLW